MEYCGEVMNYKDFQERAERYDRENRRHYYFMTLRADEVNCTTCYVYFSQIIYQSYHSPYQFVGLFVVPTYYLVRRI